MKQGIFEIIQNERIAKNVMKMTLRGDCSDITSAGQFINIKLNGLYLRRPISVYDCDGDTVTIIYKIVGKGTDEMSKMQGGKLDILSGLGNGYDLEKSGDSPLLIGGGVGVPPLYLLAKKLRAQGKKVNVIMGFNTEEEVFCEAEFKALGCDVRVATADGSYGIKGFVTNAMDGISYSHVYTCGPEPMLKAVFGAITTSGQFSFEERMGCGFGACMGCTCETLTGYKRICRDGPVLFKEEIKW